LELCDSTAYITRSCYVCCGDSYVTKCDNFKNSRWQMPSFQKSSFGHNSAADNSPISVKFLCEEAVFDRILVMAHIPAFQRKYFRFMQFGLWRTAPFVTSFVSSQSCFKVICGSFLWASRNTALHRWHIGLSDIMSCPRF